MCQGVNVVNDIFSSLLLVLFYQAHGIWKPNRKPVDEVKVESVPFVDSAQGSREGKWFRTIPTMNSFFQRSSCAMQNVS